MSMKSVVRGDVYFADLSPVVGSEQGGNRPVLVVQNDIGNKYSPTVIVIPITKQMDKRNIPTHIELGGLYKKSIALCEQIRTLDKKRLGNHICRINNEQMMAINKAIAFSMGIPG